MSDARITYRPRSNATPEGEIEALASIYSYVRSCAEQRQRKAGETSAGDEAKGPKNDRPAPGILPR